MLSTVPRPDARPHVALVTDTLRTHRIATITWVVAGTIAMLGMTLALAREMQTYPGGAQGLAASVMPGAEALRPLRWPAERLDTLGGYLTYHNLTLYAFFLAIFGALQGARAVRGAEEANTLELVLATGIPRRQVVIDRALGFLGILVVITLAVGVGIEVALLMGGEPNLVGSMISVTAAGLCGLVGYGLGALVAQFTRTSRAAAGIASLLLTVVYVLTNIADTLGPVGVVRYLSPFHYFNQSRALVPGHGLDLVAMASLAAGAVGLLALAALAFERRDYQAPLWHRGPKQEAAGQWRPTRVRGWAVASVWTSTLLRSRVGLIAWMATAAVFAMMMVALESTVVEAWQNFTFMTAALGAGVSAETQYLSFSAELVAPIIAAYAVAQAAGWLADRSQGRDEVILAAPVSATRLVLERLLATTVGVALISVAGLGAMAVTAQAAGLAVDLAGLGRTLVVSMLLGLALAAVAAVLVVWLRSAVAVTIMATLIGAMYLLDYVVPMFGWPEDLHRLSVFWAFNHPYLGWPTVGELALLVGVATGGAVLAAMIAEHRPEVG